MHSFFYSCSAHNLNIHSPAFPYSKMAYVTILRLGCCSPNQRIQSDQSESHMLDWSIDVANRWICMTWWPHRIEFLIGPLDLSWVGQSNRSSNICYFSRDVQLTNRISDRSFASTWQVFMWLLQWALHFMRTSREAWMSVRLKGEKIIRY